VGKKQKRRKCKLKLKRIKRTDFDFFFRNQLFFFQYLKNKYNVYPDI